ncbi:superoxide dismutase [Jidongwangia harbinensis]|uniref:superoxide dismutase n=1 Tax=Jidongwangia harbinensis TaxID=2878561 RepID=UPI001CD94BE0|nr:superoxide dismutase [Jidongwangia harbinensis]MCA2218470.1 superoxide dismutase [Jidongwangia harbinensis]
MSRRTVAIVVSTALAVTLVAPPAAGAGSHRPAAPTTLDLPAGFQPEGIAIGKQPYAYFGSRVDGDIYRVNLRTGRGRVISEGPGTQSLGMKVDGRGRLFVAGGSGGDARVIDTRTGAVLASYRLQTVPAFINDVTLTGGAAWYTDSTNPTLFKLPLGRHGALPSAATAVPLTGAIAYATPGPNANGISPTPDGRALIIVQANTGKLFHTTYAGVTTEIDLGGETVGNGDGLWLRGRTLYVVQNRLNQIAKIKLNRAGTRGEVVSRTGDPRFDVPTTIAEYGGRFYLPNARFTTPAEPTTPYTAVAVPIP